MPRKKAITLYQHNTEQIDVTISLEGWTYDLTGAAVECYIKPSAATADDDLSVTVLTVGNGIEVLDAAAGSVRVTVPSSVLDTATVRFWRVDVVEGAARRTAVYGPMHVTDI